MNSVSDTELTSYVERIERLAEEKDVIQTDIKEVYGEAKASGIDTKILRKVIARRKKDRAELQEEETLIDLYESAIKEGK